MVVVKCWQILERTIVRLFAPLLSNEHSKKHEIEVVWPQALYVSMILAALEEMVGNEENVRHGRIDSELQKIAAKISGSPFKNIYQPLESTTMLLPIISIGKELIIWEKWWNWCQILWEQASHWQGSTTEPHSSLSPPCLLLLSTFSTCSTLICETYDSVVQRAWCSPVTVTNTNHLRIWLIGSQLHESSHSGIGHPPSFQLIQSAVGQLFLGCQWLCTLFWILIIPRLF